jgi:hypothetical protein
LENNWSAKDELSWDQRLQVKGSKKILTAQKQSNIKYWLINPDTLILKENKTYQYNCKHEIKQYYELQDGQVYRKAYYNTRLGELLLTRYILCYSDAFEIMTTTHEQLLHTGKHLKSCGYIQFFN